MHPRPPQAAAPAPAAAAPAAAAPAAAGGGDSKPGGPVQVDQGTGSQPDGPDQPDKGENKPSSWLQRAKQRAKNVFEKLTGGGSKQGASSKRKPEPAAPAPAAPAAQAEPAAAKPAAVVEPAAALEAQATSTQPVTPVKEEGENKDDGDKKPPQPVTPVKAAQATPESGGSDKGGGDGGGGQESERTRQRKGREERRPTPQPIAPVKAAQATSESGDSDQEGGDGGGHKTRYQKQIKYWIDDLKRETKSYLSEYDHPRFIEYLDGIKNIEDSDEGDQQAGSNEDNYKKILSEVDKVDSDEVRHTLYGIVDLEEYKRTLYKIKSPVQELEESLKEILKSTDDEEGRKKLKSILNPENCSYYDEMESYTTLENFFFHLFKHSNQEIKNEINKSKKVIRIIKKELALDNLNKLQDESYYNNEDFGHISQYYKESIEEVFKLDLNYSIENKVVGGWLHDVLTAKTRRDNKNSEEVSGLLDKLKGSKDKEGKITLYKGLIDQLIKDDEYFKAERKLVELKRLLPGEQIEVVEKKFQSAIEEKNKEVSEKLEEVKRNEKDENYKKDYIDLSLALFELKSIQAKSDSDLLDDTIPSLMSLKDEEMDEKQRNNYEFNLNSIIGKIGLSNSFYFELNGEDSVKYVKLLHELKHENHNILADNVMYLYLKTHHLSLEEKLKKVEIEKIENSKSKDKFRVVFKNGSGKSYGRPARDVDEITRIINIELKMGEYHVKQMLSLTSDKDLIRKIEKLLIEHEKNKKIDFKIIKKLKKEGIIKDHRNNGNRKPPSKVGGPCKKGRKGNFVHTRGGNGGKPRKRA